MLIGRLVDERLWPDGAPLAKMWPALPFLLRPIVVPLPENFGEPPEPLQRLMHHIDEKSALAGFPNATFRGPEYTLLALLGFSANPTPGRRRRSGSFLPNARPIKPERPERPFDILPTEPGVHAPNFSVRFLEYFLGRTL
jgi:hypothetical protein